MPAGVQAEVSEEEARQIRKQAFQSLQGSILTVSIISVSQDRRVVMTERPLDSLSENPSTQRLQPQYLAVLGQNLGEVVEVSLNSQSSRHTQTFSAQAALT